MNKSAANPFPVRNSLTPCHIPLFMLVICEPAGSEKATSGQGNYMVLEHPSSWGRAVREIYPLLLGKPYLLIGLKLAYEKYKIDRPQSRLLQYINEFS